MPPGTTPLVWKAVLAARTTVTFAAAAMSLALVGGMVLAFLASSAWRVGDPAGGSRRLARASRVSFAATRGFAAAQPYLQHPRVPSRLARMLWRSLVSLTRGVLIFLRAIPEYVWAFLFVAVVGPTLWAAVLALAIHNTGILGKLNAEVMENLEQESLAGLRALGAQRAQIAFAGLLPLMVPRFLPFFFYRWETCVREATVLGMLGIASLGFFIQDARARQHYGVMLALILLGSAIVLVGDLVSAAAREAVRRSSYGLRRSPSPSAFRVRLRPSALSPVRRKSPPSS